MNSTLRRMRGLRPVRTIAVAGAAATIAALALTAPSALAHGHGHGHGPGAVPPPPANPTSANQIQNIDQVRTAIKGYYGDTLTDTPDPVNGATMLHVASPTSAYANEMRSIERNAERYLAREAHQHGRHDSRAAKALVFDIDDTTLNTYNYEIYSQFIYNPTTNATFVNSAAFPAVFGMPQLIKEAKAEGYTIFFITGRPATQLPGTLTNLEDAGYGTVPNNQIFLKDLTEPWLASCAPNCSTIQYKSLTRKHIENGLGKRYDIVGNFGDQYSDLSGGYSDATFKLPNPMYYLP
jgi:hypothetical protein